MTANAKATKAPLLNNTLKLFMLAMICANMGGSMYGPLLPLYLKQLNANLNEVGLFFTLNAILPLTLQILGGWISDHLGRLRSIAIGSVVGLVSYCGILLAPSWQWMLVAQGMVTIASSLVSPSFGSFIAEQSSEENRGKVYGVTETLFTIITIVGPPLGGILADRCGFRVMLAVAGAFYLIATIIRVSMARSKFHNGHQPSKGGLSFTTLRADMRSMLGLAFAGGIVTWMLVTDGMRDITFTMSFTFLPVYLQDIGKMSMEQIGWLNSVFGIALALVTIPSGWLSDRKGERVTIALGFGMVSIAIALFLQSQSFAAFAASWAIFGAGVGSMSPAYNSLISKVFPEKIRGIAMGFMNTSLGVFSLPAPWFGSQLWSSIGPKALFGITAIASALSIIPIWFKFKITQNGKVEERIIPAPVTQETEI